MHTSNSRRTIQKFLSNYISLRTALLLPFTALIIVTVSLTGYFSFRNGSKAINEFIAQLGDEIYLRTEERIRSLLDRPHLLNQIHANAYILEELDTNDVQGQQRHFWLHIQNFRQVSHSFFANTDGDFVGARVHTDGTYGTMLGDQSTDNNSNYHYYRNDEYGSRISLEFVRPKNDVRVRPWYTKAVESQKPAWSPIYTAISDGLLAISACQPVYGKDGELKGVLGSNFSFADINNYLRSLNVSESGVLFILERNGLIVSSSTSAPNSILFGQKRQRIQALESENWLIRQTAKHLKDKYGDSIEVSEKFTSYFDIQGQLQFLHLAPLTDNRGLDWLVAIVLPEEDFMEQVESNKRATVFILLGAVVIVITLGTLITQYLLRPISDLSKTAQALAEGDWDRQVTLDRRDEIGQLAQSFNRMVEHLKSLLGDLEENVQELNNEVSQRKETESLLLESKERYQMLFNNANDAVLLHQPRLEQAIDRIIEINDIACRMYGYSREEIIGKDTFDLVVPEQREKTLSQLKQLLAVKHSLFETTHLSKDGSEIPVEFSSHMFDYQGTPTILSVVRDMTSRIEAENEQNNLLNQLRQAQKLEAIGNLAGGIAHDFNNILTSMLGYTELVLHDVGADSQSGKRLHEVLKAGIRAKSLVKQILAFARRSDEILEPVHVKTVALEVISFMRSSIPTTIEIRPNIISESHVLGNTTRLHQIFMNLCTNAAQAMEHDCGILSVSVIDRVITDTSAEYALGLQTGDYLIIEVEDTGSGIPPEILESIFDPYFTTKQPGEGTGMGLAVVHGIVESYGGKITVRSVVNQGTIFSVYLPVTESTTEVDIAPQIKVQGGSEHILLVDDEEAIVEMVQQLLERLNYKVTTFTKSTKALVLFRENPDLFDLVITDMTMPEMTGEILAAELKRIRADIPVILCTGYSKKITNRTPSEIHVDAILIKPITQSELATAVRRTLDQPINP